MTSVLVIRRRGETQADIVVLCVGSFVFCWALLLALSNAIDVGRYVAEIAPFNILWFTISVLYLPYRLLLGARLLRRRLSFNTHLVGLKNKRSSFALTRHADRRSTMTISILQLAIGALKNDHRHSALQRIRDCRR